jgi:hypothetical protein
MIIFVIIVDIIYSKAMRRGRKGHGYLDVA